MSLAVDGFANTISGYLTPLLLVVVISMISYMASSMSKRIDKQEDKQDDTNDKIATMATEIAILARQMQDTQIVQSSQTAGIAKLTESTVQLNTTVSDHIRWHEQRFGPRPR